MFASFGKEKKLPLFNDLVVQFPVLCPQLGVNFTLKMALQIDGFSVYACGMFIYRNNKEYYNLAILYLNDDIFL